MRHVVRVEPEHGEERRFFFGRRRLVARRLGRRRATAAAGVEEARERGDEVRRVVVLDLARVVGDAVRGRRRRVVALGPEAVRAAAAQAVAEAVAAARGRAVGRPPIVGALERLARPLAVADDAAAALPWKKSARAST